MENPKIKTKVVHSHSKAAWNVVDINVGQKYKIARVPYTTLDDQELSDRNMREALRHAEFISFCFNNAEGLIPAAKTSSGAGVQI